MRSRGAALALWTSPSKIGLPPSTSPPTSSTFVTGAPDQFISLGFDSLRAAVMAQSAVASHKHADWSHLAAHPRPQAES